MVKPEKSPLSLSQDQKIVAHKTSDFLGNKIADPITKSDLIAIALSRQKELDANPKAIQQIEFVVQLK